MTQTQMVTPSGLSKSPTAEFISGARDTFPLIVGAVPFGIIFGTLATASGLSEAGTLAMSAFVFAGSAQFIAAGLLATGTGWPFIVLTTFVVNLRHMLYSAALAPHVSKLPQRWQIPIAFWLTDETFAVVANRFTVGPPSAGARWYYLGSALFMYTNWQLCTGLGVAVGQILPDAGAWGLEFAMPVTFIGMTIPYLKSRSMIITTLVAGAVSLAAYHMPNKLGLMVAALAGIGAGILSQKWDMKVTTRE
jgi:4-azaleucine resistance transporter AzlC